MRNQQEARLYLTIVILNYQIKVLVCENHQENTYQLAMKNQICKPSCGKGNASTPARLLTLSLFLIISSSQIFELQKKVYAHSDPTFFSWNLTSDATVVVFDSKNGPMRLITYGNSSLLR